MSKHFYLDSGYFAKVKIDFRMIFEIKPVKVFMSSLISNQFCLWWLGFDYTAVFS